MADVKSVVSAGGEPSSQSTRNSSHRSSGATSTKSSMKNDSVRSSRTVSSDHSSVSVPASPMSGIKKTSIHNTGSKKESYTASPKSSTKKNSVHSSVGSSFGQSGRSAADAAPQSPTDLTVSSTFSSSAQSTLKSSAQTSPIRRPENNNSIRAAASIPGTLASVAPASYGDSKISQAKQSMSKSSAQRSPSGLEPKSEVRRQESMNSGRVAKSIPGPLAGSQSVPKSSAQRSLISRECSPVNLKSGHVAASTPLSRSNSPVNKEPISITARQSMSKSSSKRSLSGLEPKSEVRRQDSLNSQRVAKSIPGSLAARQSVPKSRSTQRSLIRSEPKPDAEEEIDVDMLTPREKALRAFGGGKHFLYSPGKTLAAQQILGSIDKAFREALGKCTKLEDVLAIPEPNIGVKPGSWFAWTIKRVRFNDPSLLSLDFRNVQFPTSKQDLLYRPELWFGLSRNEYVQEVILNNCDLQEEDALPEDPTDYSVVYVLKNNRAITRFELESNSLGNDGLIAVIQSLKENDVLEEFRCAHQHNCGSKKTGTSVQIEQAFVDALKDNTTLKKIGWPFHTAGASDTINNIVLRNADLGREQRLRSISKPQATRSGGRASFVGSMTSTESSPATRGSADRKAKRSASSRKTKVSSRSPSPRSKKISPGGKKSSPNLGHNSLSVPSMQGSGNSNPGGTSPSMSNSLGILNTPKAKGETWSPASVQQQGSNKSESQAALLKKAHSSVGGSNSVAKAQSVGSNKSKKSGAIGEGVVFEEHTHVDYDDDGAWGYDEYGEGAYNQDGEYYDDHYGGGNGGWREQGKGQAAKNKKQSKIKERKTPSRSNCCSCLCGR